MTLLDAGPRGYPFIVRIDHLFQIGIRQNAFRKSVSHPDDSRVVSCH